jgi:hypothetical protein
MVNLQSLKRNLGQNFSARREKSSFDITHKIFSAPIEKEYFVVKFLVFKEFQGQNVPFHSPP